MVVSNRERIGNAMESLKAGLTPYVGREMQREFGKEWESRLPASARSLDSAALLNCMWEQWNVVFSQKLGHAERNYISELRGVRNKWAHQEPFTLDDAYRALDTVARLLRAVSAPQADEVDREMQEIMRVRYEEQAKREQKRSAPATADSAAKGGLKPWREVVTPHPDVTAGRYQQAEFAADLAQVHRNEGSSEYRVPRDFFARTFLTAGLRDLLANALQRLSGDYGDPVVKLQTNFGGGKTHAMIALYHLCSGAPVGDLPGLDDVLKAAGMTSVPKAERAVLVGTRGGPGETSRKPDGTEVRTLWGEMAHQLAGVEGYSLVADADRTGTAPGTDSLIALFQLASLCLILIDEWVTFVRQTYGQFGLPGGTFEANLTFAQALTEAAKAVPKTLVVASIPSSDIEVGGMAGRQALAALENTFGRVESIWRPASAEEGFEIVRRRLFEPIADPTLYTARDAVAKEFPQGCGEADYERRIIAAYPIHPELFDRLYDDWSTLERFQRTRGVLRLMAKVIQTLWSRGDQSPLIMPGSVPMDDPAVQSELTTRYLEDSWTPVVEADVNALPNRIDDAIPNLGRYNACRRVARTVFLGSAPKLNSPNKGIAEMRVKLGAAQPGEAVATYGDALHWLVNQATYLYPSGDDRYWYSPVASVAKLARDRAAQQNADSVLHEIRERVRKDATARGEFARVYPCPATTSDVPDEQEVRLVILDPQHGHAPNDAPSAGLAAAARFLDERGAAPRRFKNTLVFLAADRRALEELTDAVRHHLAWQSIAEGHDAPNLDTFQASQVQSQMNLWNETVRQRVSETYQWLLVPSKPDQEGKATWERPIKVQGTDPLAVRASKKLVADGLLITTWAPTLLARQINLIPLWRKDADHITLRQLWEDFTLYLYLPRLKDSTVLITAVRDGAERMLWETETFAYAEGWDEQGERYIGLRAGQPGSVILNDASVVVKPEAARRQLDAEAAARAGQGNTASTTRESNAAQGGTIPQSYPTVPPSVADPPTAKKTRRFYGTIDLNALQPTGDVSKVAQEVIKHLMALNGANVRITLEVQADVPDGVPDDVKRTVSENCKTLKFTNFDFDES